MMIKRFLIAIAGISLLGIGGTSVLAQQARPAQAPGNSAARTCLQIDRVETWNIVNERTMVVTDKASRKYRVTLNGNCAYSKFYDQVIFRPLDPTLLGCVGKGDHVYLNNRMGDVQRCYVTSISLYTDAQLQIDKQASHEH
jgi:hypothetical protein